MGDCTDMDDERDQTELDKQEQRGYTNHDEAFKKLLEVFFKEFIQLFFPELDQMLDHQQTRFLMQEQLVDIVGKSTRTLDLLLETKYRERDALILIHFEPQSYKDDEFLERMFIYYSRLFERHRKNYEMIIPIAIFTYDGLVQEPGELRLGIPGHEVLCFRFMKVELRNHEWRQFIDSDNPVAAALLSKMSYNKEERRELRLAYLRMILRLQHHLDDARMALIMSINDLYFKPTKEEDQILLEQLREQYAEEGVDVMELMPAWKKWAYEEGMQEGLEKGIEKGIETGLEKGKEEILRKFLDKGFSPEVVAETVGAPLEDIRKLLKS